MDMKTSKTIQTPEQMRAHSLAQNKEIRIWAAANKVGTKSPTYPLEKRRKQAWR